MGNYHSNSGYGSSNCNPCSENSCNAAVLTSDTLTNADNYPWKGGEFKIPKVLAEFVVQVDTEAKIKLNDTAYEIKRVEKQVFLTQCRYIPPTDKVFLEGYIRKNIEYASKTCSKGHAIGGTIKDTTVHIPFKAYTKIDFGCNRPIITPNLPPMVARYFDEQRLGKNIREADRSDIEIFNEPVYCELEWTAVLEMKKNSKSIQINQLFISVLNCFKNSRLASMTDMEKIVEKNAINLMTSNLLTGTFLSTTSFVKTKTNPRPLHFI